MSEQNKTRQPKANLTMDCEERMEDYAAELEASFQRLRRGDQVSGKVLSVDENGLLVDLEYFTPGRVPADQISEDPSFHFLTEIRPGQEVKAIVTGPEEEGYVPLSVKDANRLEAWDTLKKMKEERTVYTGKVTEVFPKGAVMFVQGIRGFIPASRLSTSYVEDTKEYLNQTLSVLVTEVDEEDGKLILSARELKKEEEIKEKNQKVNRIKVDSVVEGTVEKLRDFGAFVDLGDGISGLLHISQIRTERVHNIYAVLKEGQKVRVKIIKVENGKISLSMKALEEVAAHEEEEGVPEYHSDGEISTSLGSLLAGIKLD
ncbi:MAG: S1 RNA-binding domain-containing protein [Lachnospiraceae bacterium]|nr:S1 RNA-binding domain-containing protein [Lachnospiraceae bacterium]